MTIRGSYFENVEELDKAILPKRAEELEDFYNVLVGLEENEATIAELIFRKAIMLSTTDGFATEQSLLDAVSHGLRVLWLNTDRECKELACILGESWVRTVPCGMIRQRGGAYYLTDEDR